MKIGGTVDVRRSELVTNSTYLKTLDQFLLSDSSAFEATTVAHTAIKVLFNLCTDCREYKHAPVDIGLGY